MRLVNEYSEMTRKRLIGKTIKDISVTGDEIKAKFTDGTVFNYYASDGGYSTWGFDNKE